MAAIQQYLHPAPDLPATADRRGLLLPDDFTKLQALLYDAHGNILLTGGGATGGFVGQESRRGTAFQDVHLRTGTPAGSFLFVEAQDSLFLCSNLFWDGVNWNRFDTAKAATLLDVALGGLSVYKVDAGAGANPATLVGPQTLSYDAYSGLVGLGAQLFSSRTTNLAVAANTNTTLQSLTLTFGKWLVQGYSYMGTPGAINTTVDLWLNGFSATSMIYLPTLTAGITGVTMFANISVAFGTTTAVNLTARGNSTFTSYGTGGVAGFGNITAIIATRVG